MTDTNQEWLRTALCRALADLSAPADKQLAHLGNTTPVDELALNLDDVAGAAAAAHGLLTPRQLALLNNVVDQLTAMSGEHNSNLWTSSALLDADEWSVVRESAGHALAEMDGAPGSNLGSAR